jgi:hypothetical protein
MSCSACRWPTATGAQDLYAVEVQQIEHVTGDRRIVDIVDINADARLHRRVEIFLADAANVCDEGVAETGARGPQRDIRRLSGNFREIGLASRFEHVGVDRRDGDRRLLQ